MKSRNVQRVVCTCEDVNFVLKAMPSSERRYKQEDEGLEFGEVKKSGLKNGPQINKSKINQLVALANRYANENNFEMET